MGKLLFFPGVTALPFTPQASPLDEYFELAPGASAAGSDLSDGEFAELFGVASLPDLPAVAQAPASPSVAPAEAPWMAPPPPVRRYVADSPAELYDRAETAHNLYAAIERLDEPHREVILRRLGLFSEGPGRGETIQEIGDAIGRHRSTVAQIESQARNFLRKLLAEREYGHCTRCGCALYRTEWYRRDADSLIEPKLCPVHGTTKAP